MCTNYLKQFYITEDLSCLNEKVYNKSVQDLLVPRYLLVHKKLEAFLVYMHIFLIYLGEIHVSIEFTFFTSHVIRLKCNACDFVYTH